MAPKSSQVTSKRASQGSLQPTNILAGAVDKLIAKLTIEARTNGIIEHSANIVNPANEALRAYRRSSTKVEARLINSILPLLNSGEGEICSRLDAQLCSIVIQTFLQAEYSRQVERGMHLLGAALYYDLRSELNERLICKKKEAIGKDCLLPLLEFFIDKENHDSMRRWVGLAFLQLLRGCEANVEKIEIVSEDIRRSLGTRLLEEKNEILRSIFGRIIREMLDSGTGPEHLWPAGTDKEMYATFPKSTEDWNSNFQEYTDEIIKQDSSDYLSFWAQHVQTEPILKFGPRGHNTAVSLEPQKLVLWAGAAPDTRIFDQSIEIPYAFIKGATIKLGPKSQDLTALAHLHLEIENDKNHFCYMDCVGTVIHQTMMVMRLHELLDVVKDLDRRCPGLDIDDETGQYRNENGDENLEPTGCEASPRRTHSQSDPVGFPVVQDAVFPGVPVREIPETQIEDLTRGQNRAKSERVTDSDDREEVVNEPEHTAEQLNPVITGSQKEKTGVKPKIKTSLVNLSRSAGSKQTLPELQVSQVKSRPHRKRRLIQSNGEKLEASIAKLGAIFPSMDTPQRRGALIATNGNLADAETMLNATISRNLMKHKMTGSRRQTKIQRVAQNIRNGKPLQTNSSSGAKPTESFDTDAITSPETNDASTPKFLAKGKDYTIKPVASQAKTADKNPPKYTLKSKIPLSLPRLGTPVMKNRDKSKAKDQDTKLALPTPKPVAITLRPKGKPKAKEPNDAFDIPQDDEEFQVKKTGKFDTRSATATAKAINKTAKQSKADPKKRKSAPAALQKSVAATRSRREAAATASQKMLSVDASNNEEEEAENVIASPQKPKLVQNEKKPLKYQLHSSPQNGNTMSRPSIFGCQKGDEDAFEQQQEDARALGLSYDDVAAPETDDLYGASPEQSTAAKQSHPMKGRQTGSNRRGTKSLGDLELKRGTGGQDLASKLDTLIESLGEPPEDDETIPPPRSVAKLQAKELVAPAEKNVVVEQTIMFKVTKEHIVEQAKASQAKMKSSPLARQAPSAKNGAMASTEKMQQPSIELTGRKTKAEGEARASQARNEAPNRLSADKALGSNAEPNMLSTTQDPIVITDDESSESETASEEGHILEDIVVNRPRQDGPEIPRTAKESHESPNSSKKRKTKVDIEMPRKKKKAAEVSKVDIDQTPLRKSPCIQEKASAEEVEAIKAQLKRIAKSPMLPTRSSPRLAARDTNFSGLTPVEKTLVDDRLVRKGTVISFNAKGPRNQGPISVGASAKALRKTTSSKTPAATTNKEIERKRKRSPVDMEEGEDVLSRVDNPPKKRQSVSPGEKTEPSQVEDELIMPDETPGSSRGIADRHHTASPRGSPGLVQDDDNYQSLSSPRNDNLEVGAVAGAEQAIPNSPPAAPSQAPDVEKAIPSSPTTQFQFRNVEEALSSSPAAQSQAREVVWGRSVMNKSNGPFRGRHLKRNSQVSRVDHNGSPVASSVGPQVDHIGKAERKLLEDLAPHAKDSFNGRDVASRPSSGILGSRVILTSIPKARPPTPADIEVRYIPHNRTGSGLYEGVASNEVVEPEMKLADPFMGQLHHHASGFTERLLASASKTYSQSGTTRFQGRGNITPRNNFIQRQAHLPPHPAKPILCAGRKANGNSRIQRKTNRPGVEDAEKTLVNSENEPPSDDNPSDMTSSTSNDAFDDDKSSPSRQTQSSNEMWNIALRSHYSKLSDAVHRIADEVIIRFSNEEDALGLLIDQYEENGSKLLTSLVQDRDKQKATIEQQLGGKRQELVKIYENAKNFVDQAGESGKELPMVIFDKQWRKEQGEIQKNIDQARLKLEG